MGISDIRTYRPSIRQARGDIDPLQVVEGILGSDLNEADDTLTGQTTALLHVIEWENATTFYRTGQTIVVTNRDTTFRRVAYDYLAAAYVNGEWRPTSGGGSGSSNDIVDFEIVEWFEAADPVSPICDCVLAVVTGTSCGSSVQVGDEILVCDPALCWFTFPISILVGTRGWAAWMKREGLLADLECPDQIIEFNVGSCLWVVKGLCCREVSSYV